MNKLLGLAMLIAGFAGLLGWIDLAWLGFSSHTFTAVGLVVTGLAVTLPDTAKKRL